MTLLSNTILVGLALELKVLEIFSSFARSFLATSSSLLIVLMSVLAKSGFLAATRGVELILACSSSLLIVLMSVLAKSGFLAATRGVETKLVFEITVGFETTVAF